MGGVPFVRIEINLTRLPLSVGFGLNVTFNGTLSLGTTVESFSIPTTQPHAVAISEMNNFSELLFFI
jgi:hypothetical protein